MKAALIKSAKDAQIRDSFNKESFAIITNDSVYQFMIELNRLEHSLPRNASKLHTVLVCPTSADASAFILNFEVLEPAKTSWDGSTRHLDEKLTSIKVVGEGNLTLGKEVNTVTSSEQEKSQIEKGADCDD